MSKPLIKRLVAEEIRNIDSGLNINAFRTVAQSLPQILTQAKLTSTNPNAEQNCKNLISRMYGRVYENEKGKNKVRENVARLVRKLGNTIIYTGIGATVLTAALAFGYFTYVKPASDKPAEQTIQVKKYVRTYPNEHKYHIDAIVNDEICALSDAKGKDVSKYQIVVRMILANEQDFRMDIKKDALDSFLGVLNKSEMYDKENKTFDYGRGYHPREFARFAQAAADENNAITKESLKKIIGKTGYKQIVGVE